ncbi:MAG: hypothetical protein FJX74_00260 [Armatimonadetes bacterium]|nr:hypothetical protein [Armatimonadota bacterium]
MSVYHQSQELIAQAETRLAGGHVEEARALFREAGMAQRGMVATLPQGRVRTKSVFTLSAATLLFRADELDSAAALAYEALAQGWLEPYTRKRLEELVARIWNERRCREAGLEGTGDAISVVLFGGSILHRLAPLDSVDTIVRTAVNYIRRMGAWCNRKPFARLVRGIGDGVEEGYRPLLSEPVAGSYRIDIHLAQLQPTLPLDGAPVSPSQIVDGCVTFAGMVRQADAQGIAGFVEDERYRGALVRLVKAMIPDGSRIGEIEIRRHSAQKEDAVRFTPELRDGVKRLVTAVAPSPPGEGPRSQEGVFVGVLRAVDLDSADLRIVCDDGRPVPLQIPDELYDVVGPLLNRRVQVAARTPKRRRDKWIAEDVEVATGGPNEGSPPGP